LRHIVLVNRDGRIIGYGLGGFVPPNGEEANEETIDRPFWWVGDIAAPDPTEVRAYAVDDPASACLLGSNPRVTSRPVGVAPLPSPAPERGGFVDSVALEDSTVTIVGWGWLTGAEARVMIDTDLPIQSIKFFRVRRPHLPVRNAGIEIQLSLTPDAEKNERYRLCVWTDDPKYGRQTLIDVAPTPGQAVFVCDTDRPSRPR
jgi:hypothetical protein